MSCNGYYFSGLLCIVNNPTGQQCSVMSQDFEEDIAKIICGMKCPKDFKCYKSGFENLCKAKDVGAESFLICLDEKALTCKFISVKRGYVCECPLRIYISKKFGK